MLSNAQAALIAAASSVKMPAPPDTITRPAWNLLQHEQAEATLRRADVYLLWLNQRDRQAEKRSHATPRRPPETSPDMTPDTTPEGIP